MELLLSNYPPMKTYYKSFSDAFYGLLSKSLRLDIAVGYVSSDALIELQKAIELNHNISEVNLIVGMHYFDKFTKVQYDTAMRLNDYLLKEKKGEVRLVTAFRYHGKLYSYSNQEGPFAGIVGSNNLGSIVDGGVRQYESSILCPEEPLTSQINDFIKTLSCKTTSNIRELDIQEFNTDNALLEGHEFVEKVSPQRLAGILNAKTDISFDIPIKTYEVSPHSNLNVFFGKGRESKNGLIKPRHWYEVELIVPKKITSQPEYPKAQTEEAEFKVITDDGWSFKCKVSGECSKNLRSEGDLKILGKWLKGRLENAGVLAVGNPVTSRTLEQYGRDTFTLTKTTQSGIWFLDFGVK